MRFAVESEFLSCPVTKHILKHIWETHNHAFPHTAQGTVFSIVFLTTWPLISWPQSLFRVPTSRTQSTAADASCHEALTHSEQKKRARWSGKFVLVCRGNAHTGGLRPLPSWLFLFSAANFKRHTAECDMTRWIRMAAHFWPWRAHSFAYGLWQSHQEA